ncbi:ATP-binding protein [Nocardia amamiensis]|uniref:ATP-binding protein n=1 Tax=Nocardia amamiensis TaxID=404578 RepID=A0ABS0CRR8_9NOCA|nr:ATP-binding protein [Nocardia amamiensis]MBF6298991.1 ATP-binding protein [Nocardia amamiensis]
MTESVSDNFPTLVRQLLDRQAESRSLDYKAPMSFGPAKKDKGKILQDIVALSNTRDGGYVLIGVEQTGGRFVPAGISAEQAASFDPTRIGEFAKNHFSLLPEVSSHVVAIDGIDLLLLRVGEFDNEPIVCTKDLHDENSKAILRAGSIYVRTVDARSIAIDSGESMRAFLDLAVQKRGEALLTQIRGLVGSPLIIEASGPPDAYQSEIASAADLYSKEELTSPKAYWYVEILPRVYDKERVPTVVRLKEIRRESVVSLRGWDFPHVDRENDHIFEDGIQSVTHWAHYHEAHRFYRSGLFTWRSLISEDFTDRYAGSISYVSAIYTITEYFVFASRCAALVADSGDFIIHLGVTGLKDHVLRSDPGIFFHDYSTGAERFDRSYDVSLEELRSSHLDLAADAARRLFDLYGLDITLDVIREWQEKFTNRRF